MVRSARSRIWLSVLVASTSLGCGQIEVPISLALAGGDTISLQIPAFPPGQNAFGSTLVGGADATVVVDLNPFELFTPNGLAAAILIDRVAIAAAPIDIFGLDTGTICIYEDPNGASGGFAFLRPLRHEADFTLTLDTLISPTGELIQSLFPDPLPFTATVDQTVPITLVDLLGLLTGSGGGGLELSQTLEATLPSDIPLLGGSIVTADVTLATAQGLPPDPLLDECEAFLATP